MDSIRVSEAPDPSSILGEATKKELHKVDAALLINYTPLIFELFANNCTNNCLKVSLKK